MRVYKANLAFQSAVLLPAFYLLAWSPASASSTDADKPQIAIETKYVQISVTLDSGLKTFAALFANCVSRAKHGPAPKTTTPAPNGVTIAKPFGAYSGSTNAIMRCARSSATMSASCVATLGSTAARILT